MTFGKHIFVLYIGLLSYWLTVVLAQGQGYQQVPVCAAVGPSGPRDGKGSQGVPGKRGSPGIKGQKGEQGLSSKAVSTKITAGVTLHFPREDQISDYIRYRSYVPEMKEVTICAWIQTPGFHKNVHTILSYATQRSDNEILLYFSTRGVHIYTQTLGVSFSVSQNLQKFHVCGWVSSVTKFAAFYINGTRLGKKNYNLMGSIHGGGTLILGQEQDSPDVGRLDPSQAFQGSITDFMIWPRVLSADEINNMAAYCERPHDYAVAMTMDRLEMHGNTSYTVPQHCP